MYQSKDSNPYPARFLLTLSVRLTAATFRRGFCLASLWRLPFGWLESPMSDLSRRMGISTNNDVYMQDAHVDTTIEILCVRS